MTEYLYIDKTEYFYEFAVNGGYYFISRPRRFGKSLAVTTLKAIFQGKKELFKDLWIYDKIEYYFVCRNVVCRCWDFLVQHTQKCIEVFENGGWHFNSLLTA
mgnify:CR=1 FL=1